jgi:hypothetical protein
MNCTSRIKLAECFGGHHRELAMDVCQCKGCDRPALQMGMCNKHWRRNRRYGSPFATRNHAMQGLPVDVRFERLHTKTEGGCWEWKGSLDQDGYGVFHGVFNDVLYKRAHRFSWAFHSLSDIPKGMMVCHSCDNPKCVNPGHLWLGSAAENHDDMVAKGRRRSQAGEASHRAKVTEEQARAILADARPYSEIAAAYGLKISSVSSIKNRVSWSHLKVSNIVKNRRGSGSGNRGKSERITPEIVREIRSSEESGKSLAEKYSVSQQLITAIRKRTRWAHVN